jgi:hypothetical protein
MAGLSPVPAWLTTGTILGMIGGTTSRKVRHCYREFIAEEGDEAGRELEGVLHKVVLGSESFMERLSELMQKKRTAKEGP